MGRAELIAQLLACPNRIHGQELQVHSLRLEKWQAEQALKDAEADILIKGTADGKNAEIRKAQVDSMVRNESAVVSQVSFEIQAAEMALRCLQAEFGALKSVVRLLTEDAATL